MICDPLFGGGGGGGGGREVCTILFTSGPLFTKRTDVLAQDLVKSRSRAIRVETFPIAALKFDRHIGSSAAELPVTF